MLFVCYAENRILVERVDIVPWGVHEEHIGFNVDFGRVFGQGHPGDAIFRGPRLFSRRDVPENRKA